MNIIGTINKNNEKTIVIINSPNEEMKTRIKSESKNLDYNLIEQRK